MSGRQVGRVNGHSLGETPLSSGVLQRAAVRAVAQKEGEGTQEEESGGLRESRFVYDFSQMPIDRGSLPKEVSKTPNQTGLPDNLKAGVENLSGYSLEDVRVHYNSPKPAQLHALAYTQGTEIHVAPGQEEHLPHEAWHVVQQMQGRVKPTIQMKGIQINDDEGLEKEANVMGNRAEYKGEGLIASDLMQVVHQQVGTVFKSSLVQTPIQRMMAEEESILEKIKQIANKKRTTGTWYAWGPKEYMIQWTSVTNILDHALKVNKSTQGSGLYLASRSWRSSVYAKPGAYLLIANLTEIPTIDIRDGEQISELKQIGLTDQDLYKTENLTEMLFIYTTNGNFARLTATTGVHLITDLRLIDITTLKSDYTKYSTDAKPVLKQQALEYGVEDRLKDW